MSSTYTDDETNNAQAGDTTWGGLSDVVENTVTLSGAFLFGLLVVHDGGAAMATDSIVDSVFLLTSETAAATASVTHILTGTNILKESAKAKDKLLPVLRVWHTESGTAGDEMAVNTGSHVVGETALVTDSPIMQRTASETLAVAAVATDTTLQAGTASLEETVRASDSLMTSQGSADTFDETASVVDEQSSGVLTIHARIRESASATSTVTQHLASTESVPDWIEASSRVLQTGAGVAWVANTQNWAMSRYAPFDFTSLAVIDGVIYGTCADGVYALNGSDETITAELTTAPMDVGQGGLAHLAEAYLTYSLTGSATLTVTQTQGGSAESYTYDLPTKSADTLTSGRIPLGRGLRGRHFSFSLRLTGSAAHFDDLRITTMPVKRRV